MKHLRNTWRDSRGVANQRRVAPSTVTLHFAESCDCESFGVLVGGGHPEWYDREETAIRRFQAQIDKENKASRYLYWAIHLNGKHIVHIAGRSPSTVWGVI